MVCLRCGYCCRHYFVVIVDDPEIGLKEGNQRIHAGGGERCKHLRGDKPGEYACAVRTKPWYKETPCYAHGQVEMSIKDECRIGRYVMERGEI